MKIHGQELWADVVVDAEVLRDAERIRRALHAGATALGATVLSEHCQTFEPSGLTAIVVIGESHLLASTYEELGILAVNMQTCSGEMDLVAGLAALCTAVASPEVREVALFRRLDVPLERTLHLRDVPVRDGRLVPDEARTSTAAPEPRPASGAAYGRSASRARR